MPSLDLGRFGRAWEGFHERAPKISAEEIAEILDRRYLEDGRFYHTLGHINEGLEELDEIRDLVVSPATFEVAWYFHDVVYHPEQKNNEEASAKVLSELAWNSGVPRINFEYAKRLILATKNHLEMPPSSDSRYFLDIDLAILGKSEERFDEYDRDIRREYIHQSDEVSRERRERVLRKFLDKKPIYWTEHFRKKYESNARRNLERAIDRLKVK